MLGGTKNSDPRGSEARNPSTFIGVQLGFDQYSV